MTATEMSGLIPVSCVKIGRGGTNRLKHMGVDYVIIAVYDFYVNHFPITN